MGITIEPEEEQTEEETEETVADTVLEIAAIDDKKLYERADKLTDVLITTFGVTQTIILLNYAMVSAELKQDNIIKESEKTNE